MGDASFELFGEIIFGENFRINYILVTALPHGFFVLYYSTPAYRLDQKQKPMQKYWHHLNIQLKIAIFEKKKVFFQLHFPKKSVPPHGFIN